MVLPEEINRITQKRDKQTVSIFKSGSGTQAYVANKLLEKKEKVVLITPDINSLEEIWSLIQLFSQSGRQGAENRWIKFPPFKTKRRDVDSWADRWSGLFSLWENKYSGVLLTLDNFLPLWPSASILSKEYEYLIQGEEFSPEQILEIAINWGYERVSLVTRKGEISVRGDILDIYSPGYDYPIRLEFFGDTLESIRLFEPISQRSKQEHEEIILLPVAPAILKKEYVDQAREKWQYLWKTGELDKKTRSKLELFIQEQNPFLWPGIFYQKTVPLTDWLGDEAIYILIQADTLQNQLSEVEANWKKYFQEDKSANGLNWPEEKVIQPKERARQGWLDKRQVLFENLPLGDRNQGLFLPEKRYQSFQDLFWRPEDRRRPRSALLDNLGTWQKTQNQTVLSFRSENSKNRFFNLLDGSDLNIKTIYHPSKNGIYALVSSFSSGLELEWNKILVLAEDVLFPAQESTKKRKSIGKDFKGLRSFEGISPGDLLVHRDYGLAEFAGLTRLQVEDSGNDYLLLVYAGGDKLYVPVDKLNLVQRYKGPEGVVPSLDKLGSNKWGKTKEKVRKVLESIAHDLVEMYAYRKVTKRYSYSTDDELYQEFEATFDFEETVDQEQAIADVIDDMENPEPMDRLVCGDSGFGKTEVALRAAFLTVASGKQAALLCPTTVLAEQHYKNFQKRMNDFSVNVAMVSRFVSPAKQKKILKQAERGEIDILIGTHRLLSSDVRLPKLSLFILDEEQRFGVRHKEKLKKLRQNIDVLTLTATPIPRTLQLSLSGIRQLSVIETPPEERKPVQTSLLDRDPEVLKDILERELARQGQIFWVYNRVKGIARVKDFVQSLCPQARISIAHGQMSERRLEETMHAFWQGDLDILICTAIIESGLDFPKANTLVVDQAQMFGLGQLYQLRGRVGRSSEQAYAYFVVPSVDKLSQNASKRLRTILDLDYLGAGFQVAMEDLRLRGAGNILGEAQSGNMSKVGLDLFLEMLEQEIRKVKGEPLKQETDPELNITFEANIPGEYIVDPQERLHYYKCLSGSKSKKQLYEWAEEIRDRFGPIPVQVKNLLSVLELKKELARLQVERADLFAKKIVLSWSESSRPVNPEIFVSWLKEHQDFLNFYPPGKLEIRLEDHSDISQAMQMAIKHLEKLNEGEKAWQVQ